MNWWAGHDKKELVLSWGPPQEITSDFNEGEILIYRWYASQQSLGAMLPLFGGGTLYSAPQDTSYTRTRMFYINQEGKIYSYRWESL